METPDLSNVPSEYHEFANVFSKTKAETLSPHRLYDLKINLEEGAQPLVSPIYSLSASEQETLKEFIEENLNRGFIQPTSSLHGAPVLFVKKKDGSLCLCVDFCSLNLYLQKGSLSTPAHLRSTGLTSQSSGLLKDRSSPCLPFGSHR